MKICCLQEHYDKVVQYANSIQTGHCRTAWNVSSNGKTNGQGCEIELYYDSAPYSFGFCERYADGKIGIVGGLLYHGSPDRSFAVTLDRFHGWSIHT